MTTAFPPEPLLVEQSVRLMGTDVSVHLAVAPAQEARARLDLARCLTWLGEVERRLTRFDPASELCQLNAAAGHWQPVSALLFTAVRAALAGAAASNGLFDPALAAQLEAVGYDRDFSQLAQRAVPGTAPAPTSTPAAPAGGWRGIQLDAQQRRIRLPEGVRLDLGGIAKGWAADVALAQVLPGFRNVIVNLGGDLRLRGQRRPKELWAVGIRNPQRDHLPGPTPDRLVITFGHGGLATSGATRRWWYHEGERQHHLLDPRTGRPLDLWMHQDEAAETTDPAQQIATVTALAPTGARAEVAAKVALLRGYPAALEAVEAAWKGRQAGKTFLRADERVALLVILGNGEVVTSAHLEEYLERSAGGGMLWILD